MEMNNSFGISCMYRQQGGPVLYNLLYNFAILIKKFMLNSALIKDILVGYFQNATPSDLTRYHEKEDYTLNPPPPSTNLGQCRD